MTSPGATIVGRVGLRVIPDTSRFRKELKAKLAKMKDLTVKVDVEPDMKGFAAKVRAAAAAASKGTKVRIPVEADTRTFGQRLMADVSRWGRTLRTNFRDFITRMREANQQTNLLARGFNRVTSTIRSSGQALARMSSQLSRIRTAFRDGRFIPTSVGSDGVIETRQVRGIALAWDMVRTSIDRARTSGLSFRGMLTGLQASSRRIGTTLANGIRSAFRETFSRDRDPFSFGTLLKGFGQVFSGLGSAANSLLGILFSIYTVSGLITIGFTALVAVGAALAAVGAALAAAWGAISVAIVAIPPAVALLGIPIAAIALGLDGIKKAAKTLEPEFNRLKKLVSDTFERTFTKAFTTLKAIFPTLNLGMVRVANGIGSLTNKMAAFLTQSENMKLLGKLFDNVAKALSSSQLATGIQGILKAFLLLGSVKASFGVLTGFIEEFGTAFAEMVSNLGHRTLTKAFKGLEGTLRSLTRGFFDLVKNGILLFTKAAPGVNQFIDDLTAFFNRFDWERLGKAVGEVFSAMGLGLRNIDDSTIEKITRFFEKIGELFQEGLQSDGFTAALETIGVIFDEIVATVQTAIRELGPAFKELQPFIQEVAKEIGQGLRSAIEFVAPYLKDMATWLSENKEQIAPLVPLVIGFVAAWKAFKIGRDIVKGIGDVASGLGKIASQITKIDLEKLKKIAPTLKAVGIAAGAFVALDLINDRNLEGVDGDIAKLNEFEQQLIKLEEALKKLFTLDIAGLWAMVKVEFARAFRWGEIFAQWHAEIRSSLSTFFSQNMLSVIQLISAVIRGDWATVAAIGVDAIRNMVNQSGAEANRLGSVIQPGVSSAGNVLRSGVSSWNGTVASGMGVLRGSVGAGMAQAQGSVQTGTAGMNSAMRSGMTGFSAEARTGVNNANTQVQSGVTQMQSQTRAKSSSFNEIGRFLMQGLINGVKAMVGPLVVAAANAALAAYNAAKRALGISSPSKLFHQLGRWSVLGAAAGFTKTTPKLVRSAEQMVAKVAGAATGLRSAFEIDGSIADRLSGIQPATGRMDSFVRTQVESDGFGGIADKVASALEGWTVDIDGNGVAKMVNKSNTRNRRR